MAPLAPPLQATLNIRLYLELGFSVSHSIKYYAKKFPEDNFAKSLGEWIFFEETERIYDLSHFSPYRRNLVEILKRGLKGEPILERLEEFEEELKDICKNELEKHLEKLPFISLIPLMIFQFPAFLLLFIGPLVLNLFSSLTH